MLYEVGNELTTVNLDKGVVGSFSNRIVTFDQRTAGCPGIQSSSSGSAIIGDAEVMYLSTGRHSLVNGPQILSSQDGVR